MVNETLSFWLSMSEQTYSPGPDARSVRAADGTVLPIPNDWELLLPGDPMLTRRVKAAGTHWVVQEKRGRKLISRGVWAASAIIHRLAAEVTAVRATEVYAKRQAASAERRVNEQAEYVEDFHAAVIDFLNFHARYSELAEQLAQRVTTHATPVGSGTVARTKQLPIERRAEAAVIAWMRHQTTGYDSMKIARIKGERRETRRLLAQRSRSLLGSFRSGAPSAADCPLLQALRRPAA